MGMSAMLVTGSQLRAARALVRMEQERLAEVAGISGNTIRRLESQDGLLDARASTLRALQRALEDAGVEFQDDGRPGVRIREPADNEKILGDLRKKPAIKEALRSNFTPGSPAARK